MRHELTAIFGIAVSYYRVEQIRWLNICHQEDTTSSVMATQWRAELKVKDFPQNYDSLPFLNFSCHLFFAPPPELSAAHSFFDCKTSGTNVILFVVSSEWQSFLRSAQTATPIPEILTFSNSDLHRGAHPTGTADFHFAINVGYNISDPFASACHASSTHPPTAFTHRSRLRTGPPVSASHILANTFSTKPAGISGSSIASTTACTE